MARADRDGIERALKAGVEVYADDFSLRERGIEVPVRGVKAASIDIVIDHMAAGWSPIWHSQEPLMDKKCLTFALMDAPFESARTATAFRLLHAALDRGHDVNVFAYEGAVGLAFARQTAHPNATHGRDAEQESHPLPRVWIE